MLGEVSVQKDIYKTVEVLKTKIRQDKKGKKNSEHERFRKRNKFFVDKDNRM
jgi:hypothetical protein